MCTEVDRLSHHWLQQQVVVAATLGSPHSARWSCCTPTTALHDQELLCSFKANPGTQLLQNVLRALPTAAATTTMLALLVLTLNAGSPCC
jgi:hypothetical protein